MTTKTTEFNDEITEDDFGKLDAFQDKVMMYFFIKGAKVDLSRPTMYLALLKLTKYVKRSLEYAGLERDVHLMERLCEQWWTRPPKDSGNKGIGTQK